MNPEQNKKEQKNKTSVCAPAKSFFCKVNSKIKEFFVKIGTFIKLQWKKFVKLWDRFLNTKPMKKVRYILGYIPNWLADHIPYRKRKIIWGVVFIVPLIIGFIYFFLAPFIVSMIYSFSDVKNKGVFNITWSGLKNYKYVFTEAGNSDGSFTELLVDAVLDIVFDVPVILIFSLIMAVVLNSKFKGRAFVRAVFFMPVIFNSQAIDMAMTSATAITQTMDQIQQDIFSTMFSFQDYLLNANMPTFLVTFLGDATSKIYEIISYSGVQILIFLSALQSVPKHLYEAAKIEGATQYEMFWKITFPMVSPMMLTAAVYTIVDSFLTSPLVDIISDYNDPKSVTSEILGTVTNYGIHSAMSWVFCLLSVLMIAITLGILSKAVFYYDE